LYSACTRYSFYGVERPLSRGSPGGVTLNLIVQDVGATQLRSIKDKLRHFFEYGDGAQCNITSLFFCEKIPGSAPGTLGRARLQEQALVLRIY
jgi:hypothetical protein